MKSQISNIIIPAPFACSKIILMLILIFLISITSNEAARILNDNNEKEVDLLEGGKYLLLQSLQWRPVPPPTPNLGTNARTQITSHVSQRNFAGRKEFAPLPPCKEYLQTKIALGVATN
ncbi:hypothetical protein MTR67_040725 [Solanum verrucosum]|uniref:Uncharacterized protein n=1 Tax=Solanum verrucosum TaxID=315347 RepID=A0AAF0UKA6_SOLVR|nr:hypothetical protein MTR67_040725 [Solanum verrucosum]